LTSSCDRPIVRCHQFQGFGAGKSTLFECISGFVRPDEGEVRRDGECITGIAPDAVCRRGIARTARSRA